VVEHVVPIAEVSGLAKYAFGWRNGHAFYHRIPSHEEARIGNGRAAGVAYVACAPDARRSN